jgi:glycosyltransferase involved in cell wall biosynthesis
MPDAELHIYGEGPARPGLARLAEERGLAGRVKLMPPVPIAEVPALMAGADVGVVPKRADGFGNEAFSTKVLEFMACGVPVIVSRTRVDMHYFSDAVVRFFIPGDPTDLARVMLDVYRQRGNHEDWVRAARAFAVANSWDERVADYLAVVDRLLPPRRGVARANRSANVPKAHLQRQPEEPAAKQ